MIKRMQTLNIESEPTLKVGVPQSSIAWSYTLPFKTTSFYLLVSVFGILFVWLGLNYIHSYILTVVVIFGLIIVIGKTLVKQELNFLLTDECISLESQKIQWSNIKQAIFLPYHKDYLIALQPITFPYTKMYIPAPKEKIEAIMNFLNTHTTIKDFKTESVIDRLIRFLIF